ncbi:MAG: phosphotransferase [Mariprofundales bacterium]
MNKKNNDQRLQQATQWLALILSTSSIKIVTLAEDASFRRYFRVYDTNKTWVLMDAPPKYEDLPRFLRLHAWLENIGIRVPICKAYDELAGFALLEDFGDTTWAAYRKQHNNDDILQPLFADAIQQLLCLQAADISSSSLPVFDVTRMQHECDLYIQWYLAKVVGYQMTIAEQENWHAALRPYWQQLAALPAVPVHLDYHSRNLMLAKHDLPLGIIDFQDAVLGQPSYDLASLLYDCYQDYPESLRQKYSHDFYHKLPSAIQTAFSDVHDWHKTLRLSAFQRHLKALGIFARLAHRDGKTKFLQEIPLTHQHLQDEIKFLGINIPFLSCM